MMNAGAMRIAIVGCGAMGSLYAVMLSEAGHDVLALSRNAAHVEAINERGLRLSGASGDRNVRLRAATRPEGPPADLVVLATKSFQAAEAVREAAPLFGPQTPVLTIQNGLGASEAVADIIGPDRLAVGIAAAFGAAIRAPGHAHHASLGSISLGAHTSLERNALEWIAGLWSSAGLPTAVVDDIAAMQWEKLICNVAFSGLCGATGLTVGDVMDSPHLRKVSENAATEAFTVARAAGIALSVADPVAHARTFGEKVRAAKPSVLLDLEAGRRSEIEFINGAIDSVARRVGMTAPVNATITALVLDRERRLLDATRTAAGSGGTTTV